MHYVCSDIHGRWERYEAMVEGLKLSGDDRLYILGDVIDRGDSGIRILQHIKDQPNMTFFLGNHEMILYNSICMADEEWMDTWLLNGGKKTIEDFVNLNREEQDGLLEFLEQSWAVMPDLAVGENHYYLVHAFPDLNYLEESVSFSRIMREEGGPKRFYDMMWSRADRMLRRGEIGKLKRLDTLKKMERKVIFGHTITTRFFENMFRESSGRTSWDGGKPKIYYGENPDFTCIDCGCAMRDGRGCLGVLRLEDGEEFYF